MAKLSSSIQSIQANYDVVVIGSGYGGAICASRFARAGKRVCLLERGKEISPGEYPETPEQALPQFQVDAPEGHLGSHQGLYDFRLNPEVSVLVGCGLGGTSLINANVSLKPDPRVFENGRWPRALLADRETLDLGYWVSQSMLRPATYPDSYPRLPKMEAHGISARAAGKRLTLTPINVTFEDGPSPAGVPQKACNLCGNCVTGCNHSAKNTLLMNYLPDARNHGAEIFCGAMVSHIEKGGAEWVVHFDIEEDGQPGAAPFVRAPVVIVAAGVLGSTEILLRSRDKGLPLSGQLGKHFSGNGDMLAFSYNAVPEINGIGWPGDEPPSGPQVGPTITSAIDLRGQGDATNDVLIEEGAIPSAIATFAADALFAVAKVKDLLHGDKAPPEHRSVKGAAKATQTYLVMSLDDDKGEIYLRNGRARIDWPSAGCEPDLRLGSAEAKRASDAIGGNYLIDPIWSKVTGRRLITVHPLGGCAMGDDATAGVTDDRCRVFSGSEGAAVHEGLFVCDGSVIPSPLGVNPLWTICAVTERACHYLAEARGWRIDYTIGHHIPEPWPEAPKTVGIRFNEQLEGFFKIGETEDYHRGYDEGKATGSGLVLSATIETRDLDDMLASPKHEATLIGTVTAPALATDPLMVNNGVFNLLVEEPDKPDQRFMHYRMQLTAESGKTYFLVGKKGIGDDPVTRAWHDTTTLHVTVHDGPDADAPALGKGIIQIGAANVLKLVESIEVLNAGGFFQRARAVLRFVRFFLGAEAETYLKSLKL